MLLLWFIMLTMYCNISKTRSKVPLCICWLPRWFIKKKICFGNFVFQFVLSSGFFRVIPRSHQPKPSLQEGRLDIQPWTRPATLRRWIGGSSWRGATAWRRGGRWRWGGSYWGWHGEVYSEFQLPNLHCVSKFWGLIISLFVLSAQGLPCHPSTGSVWGGRFGPGWWGSIRAVTWSPCCCWRGNEEKGQGAGNQWTTEERTALW